MRRYLAVFCCLAGFTSPIGAITPPPPVIYDPNPGPYYVFVTPKLQLDAEQGDVLDLVINAWKGERMGFLVCFRAAQVGRRTSHQRSGMSFAATTLVARALRERKAKQVFLLGGSDCPESGYSAKSDRDRVEILGIWEP